MTAATAQNEDEIRYIKVSQDKDSITLKICWEPKATAPSQTPERVLINLIKSWEAVDDFDTKNGEANLVVRETIAALKRLQTIRESIRARIERVKCCRDNPPPIADSYWFFRWDAKLHVLQETLKEIDGVES